MGYTEPTAPSERGEGQEMAATSEALTEVARGEAPLRARRQRVQDLERIVRHGLPLDRRVASLKLVVLRFLNLD